MKKKNRPVFLVVLGIFFTVTGATSLSADIWFLIHPKSLVPFTVSLVNRLEPKAGPDAGPHFIVDPALENELSTTGPLDYVDIGLQFAAFAGGIGILLLLDWARVVVICETVGQVALTTLDLSRQTSMSIHTAFGNAKPPPGMVLLSKTTSLAFPIIGVAIVSWYLNREVIKERFRRTKI